MIVRRIAAGTLAGALAIGLAGPVVAKGKPEDKGPKSKVKGTTSVMFTKSVKNKLAKDGITVDAVAPGVRKNKVKFTFPASQSTSQFINHTGGLSFVRAEASLTVTDFVFDLQNATVDVTVPGSGPVENAFDLGKLKNNKKTVTAKLNVAPGKAALLNGALKTSVFSDGMFVAKTNTTF